MIIVHKNRTIPFESVVLKIDYHKLADCYDINAYTGDKYFAVKAAIPTYYEAKRILEDIVVAYKRGDKIYET